jgi:hypothetical protein
MSIVEADENSIPGVRQAANAAREKNVLKICMLGRFCSS